MNKIFIALNKINGTSEQIIKSGIILSIGLLFCALIIKNNSVESYFDSLYAFNVAIAIFAECFIGGLLLDYCLKTKK